MECDAVQPRMRTFLDDLLDEKDHCEMRMHLENCEPCRKYASSVGTLSYRLYELGQAPLPPDMVSAILYESKKPAVSPPAAAPEAVVTPLQGLFLSKKELFWAGITVLLALVATSFAVTTALRKKQEKAVSVAAIPVSPTLDVPAADAGSEAEQVAPGAE